MKKVLSKKVKKEILKTKTSVQQFYCWKTKYLNTKIFLFKILIKNLIIEFKHSSKKVSLLIRHYK